MSTQDSLNDLKERAKVLGVQHSPNIKEDALRQKITDKLAEHEVIQEPAEVNSERTNHFQKVYAEGMKLVRVEIHPNRPEDIGLQGDEFAVSSKYLGFVYKYVRFGVPTHLPNCLLEVIKEKVFTQKISDGGTGEEPRVAEIRKYNIEVLEALSEEEIEKINFSNRQAGR